MSVTTTTREAVRETLITKIKRIKPRLEQRQNKRWQWTADRKSEVTGRTLRQFQVHCGPQIEVPDGAYGGGIRYAVPTTIRVGYPLNAEEMARTAGADAEDLTAMLVRLHYDLPGMFPVSVYGRDQQLLLINLHQDKEQGYVVDFVVLPGLHYFADDQVELHPE